MILENIMLNESSQTEKTTYVCFYLYEITTVGKSIEAQGQVMVAKLGNWEIGYGYEVSFWGD